MIGYPELLTDPSYFRQIVVMTYPILGSYGVPSFSISDKHGIPLHYESDSIKVKGYVIHSLSNPSHWSGDKGLDEWLTEENVPGIRRSARLPSRQQPDSSRPIFPCLESVWECRSSRWQPAVTLTSSNLDTEQSTIPALI